MEIKFRAWCTFEEKIYNKFYVDGHLNYAFMHELIKDAQERYLLMQYTGLKDSKGNEIYLSDLIKDEKGNIVEVVFESGCFGFKKTRIISFYSEETTEIFYPIYEYEQSGEDFFVVGNIYENPELLKRP